MTQLPLAPRVGIACSWVQSTALLDLPAHTPCVLAPRYDIHRDGIVRDEVPAGRTGRLGDVPAGGVAWVQSGETDGRWRAVEVR